ncbi:MAG: DUF4349 domain-containing protein, partial [Nitrososphaerales archaeon]
TMSDDVTEEYVDLQARLTNLDRQEARLQEILGLARNVDEVLKIENELERVRGEIERLTGRINYLESNVAMSTISVNLNQPGPAPFPEVDWFEPFRTGILFFFGGFRGVILAISAGIPVFVVGAPLYIGYRKLKARLNRGQEREPSRTV